MLLLLIIIIIIIITIIIIVIRSTRISHLVVALFRLGALPLQDFCHRQLQTLYS